MSVNAQTCTSHSVNSRIDSPPDAELPFCVLDESGPNDSALFAATGELTGGEGAADARLDRDAVRP